LTNKAAWFGTGLFAVAIGSLFLLIGNRNYEENSQFKVVVEEVTAEEHEAFKASLPQASESESETQGQNDQNQDDEGQNNEGDNNNESI
jgi:hypothetical protein